ncbi:DoxX family protein [Candidatus Parcubacteria bacterium]|nr:DoxX family protein [Candidatus Parcubacteria bacterium]
MLWDTHALLVARVLMGGMFLLAGIDKLQNIDGIALMIAGAGLPAAGLLAWLSGIFEVLAGAAIIVGYHFREAAVLLALFTLVVAFLFHTPTSWTESPIQKVFFMKDMAIFAGLLFMAAHGSGNTWKVRK